MGTLPAKLNVRSAFRLIPVHPDDRPLLGFQWQGVQYVDSMLPFGLRSAPKIFTAVADALEWVARQRGVLEIDHYLDDFVTLGPHATADCQRNLDIIIQTFTDLGIPLALEKLEGPTTCLTFLGIEINTLDGTLRLPQDKFDRLLQTLQLWSRRKSCMRLELESLLGLLQHACRVIRPGRSFLRRLIDLLRPPRRPHDHIRLNRQSRADIQWWRVLFPPPFKPGFEVTSDASGNWGCGGWSGPDWLQFQWPKEAKDRHITFKQLVAILRACAVWGDRWAGSRVTCKCDNQAVVQMISSRSCRDQSLMHLLRCLFFMEAQLQFELTTTHIAWVHNSLADDLSRNRRSSFLSKAPWVTSHPSPVPVQLAALLLDLSQDWMSPSWTQQFSTIVRKA